MQFSGDRLPTEDATVKVVQARLTCKAVVSLLQYSKQQQKSNLCVCHFLLLCNCLTVAYNIYVYIYIWTYGLDS